MSEGDRVTDSGSQLEFFSWVMPALKTPRVMKTWMRCCIAFAAALVLIVDDKTLSTMGQTGFFTALVAVMLPPSLALSLFCLAAITLLLGTAIGWAWGCAGMAAALSVRSQTLLAQQQKHAQASLVQGIPVSTQIQTFIFHGMFLDPRSSTVYGAFLFLGTFALGALRAYIPKLALLSIFGSIILDITCTYGPSFPTAQYTLPKMLVIPACYYIAIAISSLVLIFPESLNHVWLASLGKDFLDPILEIISVQSHALASQPSNHKGWAALTEKASGSRQALVVGTQALQGQIGFIDLEVSIGRLGPGDLKRVSAELRSLMFRAVGLHAFQVFVNNINITEEEQKLAVNQELHSGAVNPSSVNRYTILLQQIREREGKHGHDLDSLVPILERASADLRSACEAAIKGATEWFRDCNSDRWAGFFFSKHSVARVEGRHQRLKDELAAIQRAMDQFHQVERVRLIKPFERFFDQETGRLLESVIRDKNTEMFAARSLFTCFVFSDALNAFADEILKFLTLLIDLDAKRPKPRLWTPSGFGKIGRKIMNKIDLDATIVPLAMGTSNDPTQFTQEDSVEPTEDDGLADDDGAVRILRKNPDALPPTTMFGRFFLRLASVLRFFKSPEGIFALRHGVVSVVLWIPSVCSSSTWFYYTNKGLWALIMAQTGLSVYAGDQIAGFIMRMTGTILGLLVGMAVWYIGAGHGNGNPYGIVVATTFFVAPFLLGRIAAPAQYMILWTLTGVTIVFVVGYSWIDTHVLAPGNSGVGVELGWKRALLVIVGFTAGFIVMLFPRPTSSRTLVRQTLAATMEEVGNILVNEVEALLAEEARERGGNLETVSNTRKHNNDVVSSKETDVRRIAQRVLNVATRLQGLASSLKTARFEPQVQGIWPNQLYERLFATQARLLSALVLFTGAFRRLDTRWCSILVHRTPFLNPNLLSDIFSNISIISYALAGGHPLPASLPVLRDRIVYHERHSTKLEALRSSRPENPPSEDDDLDFKEGKVDGSSIGFEELTLGILTDDQLPTHSTALVALSNMIFLVDEAVKIIRELCGETPFRGFDALQKDFLGREEKAIGDGFVNPMR